MRSFLTSRPCPIREGGIIGNVPGLGKGTETASGGARHVGRDAGHIGRVTTNSAIRSSTRLASESGRSVQRRAGPVGQLPRAVAGVLHRLARQDQVADPLDLVRVPALQQRPQQRPVLARGGAQEVDHGERHLPLLDVDAQCFADRLGVADDVEDVVLDLERGAQGQAVGFHPLDQDIVGPGELRAEQAAGGAQDGGLAGDDLEVRLLAQVEVVAVVDLQQLALAHAVGGAANDPAGELRVEAGAEVEAVADEVIAQHHRRLVAAEVVDCRALAAQLGFVEHVVVDERGHVDHLDDGRQHGVGARPASPQALPVSSTSMGRSILPRNRLTCLTRVLTQASRWPARSRTAFRRPRAAGRHIRSGWPRRCS